MDISKTYRMQQQYYSGFAFLPMESVKKHNYFVYKFYAAQQNLYPVFDSVLNKEVLDNHYIISIHQAIQSSGITYTAAVMADLEYAQDAVSLFFRETNTQFRDLAYVTGAIRILQRSLANFTDVQERLNSDLKNLLSGHEFTSLYKTSSEDIGNIIDVLQQVCKGIQRNHDQLKNFIAALPLKGDHKQPASVAKYCVHNLAEGLVRWRRVQETIIHQLRGWRAVRVQHERQELLN
jgi:hypothetical protein